ADILLIADITGGSYGNEQVGEIRAEQNSARVMTTAWQSIYDNLRFPKRITIDWWWEAQNTGRLADVQAAIRVESQAAGRVQSFCSNFNLVGQTVLVLIW
ncbi:unnamed protein product, partial [marine sediment metagenome]